MPTLAVLDARTAGNANLSNAVVVWTGPIGSQSSADPDDDTDPEVKAKGSDRS